MEFVAAATDTQSLRAYAGLMKTCFPSTDKFTVAYLQWLYADNPDGPVVGFDAFEQGRLVAHYACVPATAIVEGSHAKVLLSLNTATHPEFQGKGLFTKLGARTYEMAASARFDAVYGVANANSTPGFVRKLGFQLVTRLDARVGVGPLLRGGSLPDREAAFRRTRTDAAMQWRCANPANAVAMHVRNGVAQCFAPAFGRVVAYHEFEEGRVIGAPVSLRRAPAPRLFLGLVASPGHVSPAYIAIPDRLRPSPLNLIYKPLSGRVLAIERDRVSFSFMDFDAY